MGFYGNDCGSSATSNKNRWEHVAFVYNKATRTQEIYVNGRRVRRCTGKASYRGTTKIRIGQWGNRNRWVGQIKDARIFNWALSAAEISGAVAGSLKTKTIPGSCSPEPSKAYSDLMVDACKALGMKPVCDHPNWCKNDAKSLYIGQSGHLAYP